MKRFIRDNLEPALIIAGRNNQDREGRLIRGILGSFTNHNCIILKHNTRGFCIGETAPPRSKIVTLEHYENLMNRENYVVKVWRIRGITEDEQKRLCYTWQDVIDGKKYSKYSLFRLWVFRIVNSLPYHIKGNWCTRALGEICHRVFNDDRNPFRKVSGKLKKNETPRTLENRLVRGILEDVTDRMIEDA